MNGAILIDFGAVLLTVLLVYQSIRYKAFYIKPFIGIGMFILFGVTLAAMAESPVVLSVSGVPTLLISALGALIGLGWALEGLDKLSHLEEGKK